MMRRFAAALLLLSVPAAAKPRPVIESFSPQGLVKGVRQVSVRFSEPMVPFGDPRGLSDPFRIDCPAKGAARWADSRNWEFDFDADLPAGTECRFKARWGLRGLAGGRIKGQRKFSFSTGGPAVLGSEPYEGGPVSEDQVFILRLDAPAAESSVLAHAHFEIDGVLEQVGARIVSGEERRRILETQWGEYENPTYLLLAAKRRLPAGGKVSLVWGKGISTPSGVATAQDQTLVYKVRDDFKAEFSCERTAPEEGCIPFLPMTLRFSAPVAWDAVKGARVTSASGGSWGPDAPEGKDSGVDTRFVEWLSFKGPFPAETDFKVELPDGIADDAGRALANAASFPLAVRTADFPPLAKFSGRFGILELKASPALPVTLRNLEPEVNARLLELSGAKDAPAPVRVVGRVLRMPRSAGEAPSRLLSWLSEAAKPENEWDHSLFSTATARPREFALPKPNGAKAFEVIGIPLARPGLYVVELESPILGQALFNKPASMYVPAAALVTDMSVHLKWGRESSLVWVTALGDGRPVEGAAVKIGDCRGKTLWEGRTDASGLARAAGLPAEGDVEACEGLRYPFRWTKLVVTAEKAGDMSFVLDNWNEGIEPWRFQLPFDGSPKAPLAAHTVFDRTLLRAGETVHMKHFLRRQVGAGFSTPAAEDLPPLLRVEHEGSGQKYEFPLVWDARASAETVWEIPKEAKLGTYFLSFVFPEEKSAPPARGRRRFRRRASRDGFSAGSFRVEEFRVPLLKATITPPAGPILSSPSLNLDLMVRYLSGGGVGGLPVKLRCELRPREAPEFESFEGFTFANGPAPEGREGRRHPRPKQPELAAQNLTLDQAGAARAAVTGLPAAAVPSELLSELEFRDPNGETQTVSSRVPVWPAAALVGLKLDSWLLTKDSFKFTAAAADTRGRPAAGVPVEVEFLQRKVSTHRKRLVGGFYAYENSEDVVRVSSACAGVTDAKGFLYCDAKPPVSGNVILQARARDAAGRETAAHLDAWIAEGEDWWFSQGSSDRIDVVPERKRYEPGETAAFQVRMPFREATALVTVEREGIVDAYVRRLSGKDAVVHVPIKGAYSPNVFVSVLVVRGRAGEVEPTALVDLGRPAYKLGVAEIKVGWRAHELKVSVAPDREVYKVREKAKVHLTVRRADGGPLPEGSEAAVAAVDAGLLELMPNESWKLLDAMMGQRGIAVRTATAQMQVVGKRHFGLKSLPQGGGGGRQPTRELFDTLLAWIGRVKLDKQGQADVEIPLNDSVTGFRIAAVADGGADLFGTGEADIRSSQDLTLYAGLAPLVREGDRFRALFTVRNASDKPTRAELSGRIAELPGALTPAAVDLTAGEAKELSWEVVVPTGIAALHYELEARGAEGGDRLKAVQRVIPAVPVRVFQATLSQLDAPLSMTVELPKDAVAGRGGVRAAFSRSLAGQVSGIEEYMRQYPYGCLEQKVSKAVALQDRQAWARTMAELPAYLDSDGLAKFFPGMRQGSDGLTAYLLSIADEAGWEIPEAAKGRMADGLAGFVGGKVVRGSPLPTADLGLRKLAALEALSRLSRVQPKMLSSVAIEPNLWPTSAVIDWYWILKRVRTVPERSRRYAEAEQILRSRLNFQGTTMGFSTDTSDCLWWLLVSNDLNAVRFVLSHMDELAWHQDIPRLLRGAVGRQRRGHWDLTLANAWGRLALDRFVRRFESEPVAGSARAELAGASGDFSWGLAVSSGSVTLPWPAGRAELKVTQRGTGKPWAIVSSLAAIPLKQPLSTGYRIKKSVTPVSSKSPGILTRGDVVRVRLELKAQADMTWVVVDDPIPGGAAILGTGLGRDSELSVRGETRRGWVWPAFEERSFEAFRAYYEFVPKGDWTVEYTMRLNNEGTFQLPATRVEAMYSPEMFGESPNASFGVGP